MPLSSGARIGPYEIRALIAAGGMGEVYRALDPRLNRSVAIKILQDRWFSNAQQKQRFLREARTVSALNHPGIIHIYDILSHGESDAIVMEHVEGKTLRNLLQSGQIEKNRALDITTQVSSALAAAHKAGIIHRDIKPENIMVTNDHHVKVLDFGLAKPMFPVDPNSQAATDEVAVHTTEGSVMGTAAYMSPEQARGMELDHRTDIFSTGLVLYEMLTRKRAFPGNTSVEILHSILHDQPAPLQQFLPEAPPALSDIVDKCLAKDPEERYQHISDLALDLKRLQRAASSSTTVNTANVSSTVRIDAQKSSSRWIRNLGIAALAVALAAAGFYVARKTTAPSVQNRASWMQGAKLTPLTVEDSYEAEPTFSPNGETIAYVSNRTGNFEIFLKQVSGGPDINLSNDPADDVQPSFSPDGKQIAFVSTRRSSLGLHYPAPDSPQIGGDIWVMTTFGGSAKRIVEGGNFPSWSPDGQQVLYAGGSWFNPKLYRVSANGGKPQEIPLQFPDSATPRLFYPKYSPSGKWILLERGANVIGILPAQGGEVKNLFRGSSPAWINNDWIIYSNADPGKNFSLWRAAISQDTGIPTGESEPLTFGHGKDMQPAVAPGGKRIAFTTTDVSFNIESQKLNPETGATIGTPEKLTHGKQVIYFLNHARHADSIVFSARRGAGWHLWTRDAQGNLTQITSDERYRDNYPRYSPDGSKIAFSRADLQLQPTERGTVWLMASDGANPEPLNISTQGFGGFFAWMPDGSGILSRYDRKIYRYDLKTRKSIVLSDDPSLMPVAAVTPDNKWMVVQTNRGPTVDIVLFPADGIGSITPLLSTPNFEYHPTVSSDGKWLYFQYNHKNIYRVPGPAQNWRKQEPQKITDLPESGLFVEDPQITPAGNAVVYSRGDITGDIWLLEM